MAYAQEDLPIDRRTASTHRLCDPAAKHGACNAAMRTPGVIA